MLSPFCCLGRSVQPLRSGSSRSSIRICGGRGHKEQEKIILAPSWSRFFDSFHIPFFSFSPCLCQSVCVSLLFAIECVCVSYPANPESIVLPLFFFLCLSFGSVALLYALLLAYSLRSCVRSPSRAHTHSALIEAETIAAAAFHGAFLFFSFAPPDDLMEPPIYLDII